MIRLDAQIPPEAFAAPAEYVVPAVAEVLEGVLADARRGVVIAVGLVTVHRDGTGDVLWVADEDDVPGLALGAGVLRVGVLSAPLEDDDTDDGENADGR